MALDRYLSPKELAEVLGVPVSTVYLWQAEGSAPRRARVGKHIRYAETDVEAWLEERAAGAPREAS